MPDYAVYLGAVDWRHPDWVGAFYPEDMPEEWRLAYYSNQFRCVFLERDAWTAASPAEWSQWAEDAPAGFRFILEGRTGEGVAATAVEALGERLVLVAGRDDPSLMWFGAGDDLRRVAAEIRERAGQGGVYVLSRDGDLKRLEEMQTLLELLGL